MSEFQERFDCLYDFGLVIKKFIPLRFKIWVYEQGFEKFSEKFDLIKINKGNEKELRRILKSEYYGMINLFIY